MSHGAIADHLLREVQLASNAEERERYDSLADIFAILRTLEFLERAYIRSGIEQDDYCRECDRLLSQFKLAKNLVGDDDFNVKAFMTDYSLNCPSALNRIKAGVNQVTLDGGGNDKTNNKAKDAAECAGVMISLSDALELGDTTKEAIHPSLVEILRYLHRFSDLPADFTGKQTLQKWITVFAPMGASDSLNETQLDDIKFDADAIHTAFKNAL